MSKQTMQPEPVTAQCALCGVETDTPSGTCPICADERQYLPADGVQRWSSPAEQARRGAAVELSELEPGLWALDTRSDVGIGQQAKLIVTQAGNVLVDVPAFIDDAAIEAVRALGGLAAIVPSHPHMFGVQSAWSAAFDDAPVWVSEPDARWVARSFPGLRSWSGELEPVPGIRASQPGGHFPGSSVVHFRAADGAGVLLSGDTIAAVPRAGWVTFLRSFPNRLPLSAAVVRRIAAHVGARYDVERLYDNFEGRVLRDAGEAIASSAERYARWVSGEFDHLTGEG
ncbi:MAG: hydrolase [Arthrobacter sp.]|jgi:hypothetical protein|nr:hydrolase [Arthrobacter sp.]